jgi:hypothetical protein
MPASNVPAPIGPAHGSASVPSFRLTLGSHDIRVAWHRFCMLGALDGAYDYELRRTLTVEDLCAIRADSPELAERFSEQIHLILGLQSGTAGTGTGSDA